MVQGHVHWPQLGQRQIAMKQYYTITETAELLGVRYKTIQHWAKNGGAPSAIIGGKVFIEADWVKSQRAFLLETITSTEAAAELGLKKQTVIWHIQQGHLLAKLWARTWRISKKSYEEFKQKR